jgi:predicted dehydrogenase
MSKVKIAIVGLNFGQHILKNITRSPSSDHIELVAVCDMDGEKAASYGEQYGVPHFDDLDTLLAQDDIPCIGLYTGPSGRAKLLDKIISAGKDVMTTKPFEVDCDAAYAVLKKAETLGRVIHLNSPAPCLPEDLSIVEQWSKQHDLGRAVACQLSVWVRYHEQSTGQWQDDAKLCPVAPIFRLGIYLINDLVSIFGEAEKVTVLSSRLFTGRPTPDQGQLSILFKNGAIATVMASFCVEDGDQYQNSMILNYERGTVYRNVGAQRSTERGNSGSELSLVMGKCTDPIDRSVIQTATVLGSSGQYQWENFARAVGGDRSAECTSAENIVSALRIIEAMSEADAGSGTAIVKPVVS